VGPTTVVGPGELFLFSFEKQKKMEVVADPHLFFSFGDPQLNLAGL
jgi:hypothetical protein